MDRTSFDNLLKPLTFLSAKAHAFREVSKHDLAEALQTVQRCDVHSPSYADLSQSPRERRKLNQCVDEYNYVAGKLIRQEQHVLSPKLRMLRQLGKHIVPNREKWPPPPSFEPIRTNGERCAECSRAIEVAGQEDAGATSYTEAAEFTVATVFPRTSSKHAAQSDLTAPPSTPRSTPTASPAPSSFHSSQADLSEPDDNAKIAALSRRLRDRFAFARPTRAKASKRLATAKPDPSECSLQDGVAPTSKASTSTKLPALFGRRRRQRDYDPEYRKCIAVSWHEIDSEIPALASASSVLASDAPGIEDKAVHVGDARERLI